MIGRMITAYRCWIQQRKANRMLARGIKIRGW